MSNDAPLKSAAPYRPTWWMLAVALIASIALFIQSPGQHPAIIILAIGITLSYLTRLRLPSGGVLPWVIRGTLLMVLIFVAPERKVAARFWYLDEAVMCTIGMCLQAELLVQHWLPYLGRLRLGQMIVAAAGVMVAATTTSKPQFIAFLGPLYAMANLGALKQFRPAAATSPSENTPPPRRASKRWLLQGVSLVLAVTLGYASVGVMQNYERALTVWSGKWLSSFVMQMRARAGMAGNERLGPIYNPGGSTDRTLKIRGTRQAMHLKGLTFDLYVHGGWAPVFARRNFDPPTVQYRNVVGAKTFQVDRLADVLDLLYLPYNTPGFLPPDDATTLIESGHYAGVRCVGEKSDAITYTVAMPANERAQGPLCRQLTPLERQICLDVSEDIDPGVRTLAVTLNKPTPQETILAVIQNLQENHRYDPKAPKGDGDPVSEFLLDPRYKDAHCQYFAAAATMLLRCDGIPTRYVTGYFAWEPDGDNAMVVRSRDAHAWAESWIDGIGWVLVEATPANGTPDAINPPVGWYQRLKDMASDLLSAFGQFIRSLGWVHVAISGGLLTTVAVTIQLMQGYIARRKRPRIRAYTFPAAEYRQLAIEFESMLRRMGDIPSASATWGEHLTDQKAQTHRNRSQEKIAAARRFVEAYNRTRFGRPEDHAALHELEELLQQLKE